MFLQMLLLQTIYRVILRQYLTISFSVLLLWTFFLIKHLQNQISLKRDCPKFDQENFTLDYLPINWESLKSSSRKVDQSFENFLTMSNSILDMYASLKLSKQKLKFRKKSWLVLGLQKPVSVKNNLCTKHIKLKNNTLKNKAQIKYKQHRNSLATLPKQSENLLYKLFSKQH